MNSITLLNLCLAKLFYYSVMLSFYTKRKTIIFQEKRCPFSERSCYFSITTKTKQNVRYVLENKSTRIMHSSNPYNGWTTYTRTKEHFAAKFDDEGENNGQF